MMPVRMILFLGVFLGLSASVLAQQATSSVWNATPVEAIAPDATAPGTPLGPIRLVAPRNGVVSGQVVTAAGAPVTGVCGDLVLKDGRKDGPATVPASAVQVRYASTQRDLSGRTDVEAAQSAYCDALCDRPAGKAKVQPVWVTIHVPADAAPGVYEGQLTLHGGATARVPVSLEVMSYKLPDPKDYHAWIALNQSINSVSDRYGVGLYSDEHFALLESNLELLGQLGHHVLSIPVIEQNFVGVKRGLITFRRQGGKLVPDFAAMERYAQLHIKHCGMPRAVVLELWQVYMASRDGEKIEGRDRTKAVLSVQDGKGGFETVQVPIYPAEAEFWKDLYVQSVQRLGKLGVKPESILLGFYSDRRPNKEQVEFWKAAAPVAKWAGYTHGYAGQGPEGAPLGLTINPDCYPRGSEGPIRGGWNSPGPFLTSCRDFAHDDSPPAMYLRLVDMAVGKAHGGPSRGLSQLGFDFWLVKPQGSDRPIRHMDPNDRLFSKHFRLVRNNARSVTVPGPKGALATVRYEVLREGAQQTEARIVLEEALAGKRLTGQLKADVEAALVDWHSVWKRPEGDKTPFADLVVPTWQERARRLYELAGRVQADKP